MPADLEWMPKGLSRAGARVAAPGPVPSHAAGPAEPSPDRREQDKVWGWWAGFRVLVTSPGVGREVPRPGSHRPRAGQTGPAPLPPAPPPLALTSV